MAVGAVDDARLRQRDAALGVEVVDHELVMLGGVRRVLRILRVCHRRDGEHQHDDQATVVYHGSSSQLRREYDFFTPRKEGIRHATLPRRDRFALLSCSRFSIRAGAWSYPPAELDRLLSRIALIRIRCSRRHSPPPRFPNRFPTRRGGPTSITYLTGEPLANAIAADHLPMDPKRAGAVALPVGAAHDGGRHAVDDESWQRVPRFSRRTSPTRRNGFACSARLRIPSHEHPGDREQRALRRDPSRGAKLSSSLPYYDPVVVFARPLPGYRPLVAIRYGYTVPVGVYYRPWGWGGNRIVWTNHAVIINDVRWARVRANSLTYVHPYTAVPRYAVPPARTPPRGAAVRARARTGAARPARSRRAHTEEHRKAEEHKNPDDHKRPEDHRRLRLRAAELTTPRFRSTGC